MHFGFADTDLTRALDVPKLDPADVARAIVDGIAEDREEVLVDPLSAAVKDALSDDVVLEIGGTAASPALIWASTGLRRPSASGVTPVGS